MEDIFNMHNFQMFIKRHQIHILAAVVFIILLFFNSAIALILLMIGILGYAVFQMG